MSETNHMPSTCEWNEVSVLSANVQEEGLICGGPANDELDESNISPVLDRATIANPCT